jgi:DNA polymerase III epsilon subunit-like protein
MPYLLSPDQIGFKDRPLLFIDLELTGLDVQRHEIIEVAGLLVSPDNLEISNSYYAKVKPTHIETADPASLRVSGYSKSTWSDAIDLRTCLVELSEFAPNCILAGWAVHTEWDFLNWALESENLPYFYHHHLLEVWTIAYVKFYQDPTMSLLGLSKVAQKLGINLELHRPDSDIRATYQIFKRLVSNS